MPYANPEHSKARAKHRYDNQPGNKASKRAQAQQWKADNPKRYAWLGQRNTSKQRGVEFNLTFEEFVEFWGADFHLRGRKRHELVMGRYGDTGAYEMGNIYKTTQVDNKFGPEHKED